jgi:hypothetical protein
MENKLPPLGPLAERLEAYGKKSYDLVKLRAVKKTAEITSIAAPNAVLLLMLLLFVLSGTAGFALWLGDLFGHSYMGFLVIAGLYLLAALLMHFFLREPIRKWISEQVISRLLSSRT